MRCNISFWGEWSEWSPENNDTCAGNMTVGRKRNRDCVSEQGLCSFVLTKNNCTGNDFEYQRKTVEILPQVPAKTQPDDALRICNNKNLTLFTAFYLLCDKSGTISSDLIFWTNFRRLSDSEQIYYDNQSSLYLPLSSPVWGGGQPNFHPNDFCVGILNANVHDTWCDSYAFPVNKIVCDIYE